MFFGIIAITLLVLTLILFLWKKWKNKQTHIAAMVLPNNVRNIQSNPNIGCDGRNVNIVGTAG